MTDIPQRFAEVLDQHVVVYLATVNRDGSPQVSPIWIERDGHVLRFGTAEGRAKLANLRRDPRLAISYVDPKNSLVGFAIRGTAVSIERRGWELMDRLAMNYQVGEFLPHIEGVARVDIEVKAEAFHTNH